MPRGRIGDDVMKVRFCDGTFARIDAVAGNRSEFIRDAVEAALVSSSDPVAKVKRPDPVPDRVVVSQKKNSIVPPSGKSKPVSGRQADADAVLGVIRGRRLTSRQVEAEMGWQGLRYSNAEKLLLSSGSAVFADGVLVAADR